MNTRRCTRDREAVPDVPTRVAIIPLCKHFGVVVFFFNEKMTRGDSGGGFSILPHELFSVISA